MRPGTDRQPPEAPVGRAREAEALVDLVSDPGSGSVVLISGEAGIGKTTLVDHTVAGVLAAEGLVLRGAADDRDTARFSLWRRVLRDLDVLLPHVDASVGVADQVDELAANVGDALSTGRWRLLVLEDLHWADEPSLHLLQVIGERLVGRPVLVLATVRSGEPRSGALARLMVQAQVIGLRGLTPDDIALVAARSTGEALAREEASALHQMSGGNPLLVRELLARPGNRLPLAATELLEKAIDDLGAPAAHVLSVFAVAGRATPVAAIARACGLGDDQVQAAMARGEQADIVTTGPEGRWFRHDLLAAAAAGRLGSVACSDVHRALAEFWATAPSGDDDGLEQARHWLGAVPSVPAEDVARPVLEIATGLRRRRRAGDAADLLTRALVALTGARRAVIGQLWMGLGEARWDLGEKPAALECFDRASEGVAAGDLVTMATIEVARQRYHNPFIPDPDARERLAVLDEKLGAGASALRAALLGRRALLALQPPPQPDEAAALADEAVAVARRLDDPEALLVALCDRAFVAGTADDLRGRGPLAEEVLELARAAGRPDLALAGHEWRCDDRLLGGDLRAARGALDEFEALAAVAPSPTWRCSALLRRATLLLAEGDRVGALEASEANARLADGLLDPIEQQSLEMAVRAPVMVLYGHADPRFAELQAAFRPVFDTIPSTFMQVRIALGDLLVGDRAAAARRAARWLSKPSAAFEAPDALGTLGLMTILADELERADAAPALIDALAPFRGLICTETPVPTELLLAQLHLLIGEHPAGVDLAQEALGRARAMPSTVAETHCLRVLGQAQRAAGDGRAADAASAAAEAIAEREGVILQPPWSRRAASAPPSTSATAGSGASPPRTARLTRQGEVWTLDAAGESGSLAHLAGLTQLGRLLQVPGLEIPSTELTGTSRMPSADLGPALDARAKREYRRRINELQSEIDEAEQWADPERADAARRELDALMVELRRAVGLSGRDRPQGSSSERARVNAARSIRRAISAIHTVAPQLAAHLTVSIRTGHHCSYAPEPAARIEWEVEL